MVMHCLEMIKNKSQDQNNELVSFTNSYDISINIINQISYSQVKYELKNFIIGKS